MGLQGKAETAEDGGSKVMREQIKELCLFMICGQTLLHFQSGKKYEKICRMILELLVLAGVVGMILNFLQSLGIRKGDMPAAGGAVANMQRSMEEALLKQLDMDSLEEEFMSGISMESLVEKYTLQEVKAKYDGFAGQYGFEIEEMEQTGDMLRVSVKKTGDLSGAGETGAEAKGTASGGEKTETKDTVPGGEGAETEGAVPGGEEAETKGAAPGGEKTETKDTVPGGEGAETEGAVPGGEEAETKGAAPGGEAAQGEAAGAGDTQETAGIRRVEIKKIDIGGEKEPAPAEMHGQEIQENTEADQDGLEVFRRQLALVFAMDEEKLEVILID